MSSVWELRVSVAERIRNIHRGVAENAEAAWISPRTQRVGRPIPKQFWTSLRSSCNICIATLRIRLYVSIKRSVLFSVWGHC